ncbi:nitrilase-related carbon-nitrogen hydrolase [Amycolatopsis sp. NPDC049252]|uniref:nitrilase-related carbon-nitrogen hydrolase n=1 Tax=Amycolatopsis sp. NPDC049252 TaxID=3363933 RepID=UPI0037196432
MAEARGTGPRVTTSVVAALQTGAVGPEGLLGWEDEIRASVTVPGPETRALAGLSARTGASLVVGVIERDGSTLYSTVVFLDPSLGLVGKHRKLVPTARERLVWGRGDSSTLPAIPTAAGLAGAAICWENHMPLLRAAMYAKGVELWCAPTADDRDVWQASMRHIADEGRCFVISAKSWPVH